MHLFVYKTSVKNIRFISFIIIFSFYYNISFDKIIKKMFFAIFDTTLHYVLEKRTQIWQFTKQITTIKKKKRTNKLKRYLYNLILYNKCILIYIKTIYIAKLRNRTILDLDLRDNLQNLIIIKTITFVTKLEIALKVF